MSSLGSLGHNADWGVFLSPIVSRRRPNFSSRWNHRPHCFQIDLRRIQFRFQFIKSRAMAQARRATLRFRFLK